MKVFGWINKKLHFGNTDQYQRVAHRNSADVAFIDESGRKPGIMSEICAKEMDTEALLLPHVLLTIGTFGHNPGEIITIQCEEEPVSCNDVHEQAQESFPTPTPRQTFSQLVSKPAEPAMEQSDNVKYAAEIEIMSQDQPLLKEEDEKIKKRTTLADLFAAESARADAGPSADKGQITQCCPTSTVKESKNATKDKSSSSSAAATKKIQRMVTKMLKKKIHPDQLVCGAGEQRQRQRESQRRGKRGGASGNGGN